MKMGSALHAVVSQLLGKESILFTPWESDCPQTWSGCGGEGKIPTPPGS